MTTYSIKKGKAFILMDRSEWKETRIENPKMSKFIMAGRIKINGMKYIAFSDENNILWAQAEIIALDKKKCS
jgi:hypothetical protein